MQALTNLALCFFAVDSDVGGGCARLPKPVPHREVHFDQIHDGRALTHQVNNLERHRPSLHTHDDKYMLSSPNWEFTKPCNPSTSSLSSHVSLYSAFEAFNHIHCCHHQRHTLRTPQPSLYTFCVCSMNTPTTVVHTAPIQPHFEANLASLAQGSKPRAAPSLVHLDYAALLTSSSTDPLLRDQTQTFGPAGVRSIALGGHGRRPARSPRSAWT